MTLEHSTCARINVSALASLAGLRRVEGVSVVLEGDHAWVIWEPGDDRVLRAVLPVEGVELYERRGDAWHKAGHRLPSFEGLPAGDPIPLSRAVVPAPFRVEPPGSAGLGPVGLTLARDPRARPTSAAFCSLSELGRWAERALSSEFGAIQGAIRGTSALLIGRGLPAWPGSTRYWGGRVLVPIGFQVRPNLPESALVEALGDPVRDLFRVVPDVGGEGGLAVEAIPLDLFRPLTRAGVRLALVGAPSS